MLLAALAAGCADSGGSPAAASDAATGAGPAPTSLSGWPTPAGRLSDAESTTVFDRASAALAAQQTMLVNFSYERTDGFCVPQVLNPVIRLDARDRSAPVASLGLSILASNVAVGGKVYRQQPDPSGSSTVWVVGPEARTALEFVLWKPGAAGSAVAYLGSEQVAGRNARHYRAYDPAAYAGPTSPSASGATSGASGAPGASASPTPCRTPPAAATPTGTSSGTASGGASAGTASAGTPSPGGTTAPAPTTKATGPGGSGGIGGIGDYDDFWLGDDGTLLRMGSVLGELKLTSHTITYGRDLRVDVPDVRAAITEEDYARRQSSGSATASPSALG
jgi:hypothetical protein